MIGHRLRHLSPDCRRLLSVASVLGREFRLDALGRVSERADEELLDPLDEAQRGAGRRGPPAGRGGLRFSHALIRDSLYGDLGTSERLRLHRRAAEALEELYGAEREPHLAELAHHSFEAAPGGDVDKAIDYATASRRTRPPRCSPTRRPLGSTRWRLDALELRRRPTRRPRCELLLALGDAQARGGDVPAAKETFVRAADVARSLDAPEQLARAALGYGGRFVWFRAGKDRRLIPLLEDALEALPAGDNRYGRGCSRASPVPCAITRCPSGERP